MSELVSEHAHGDSEGKGPKDEPGEPGASGGAAAAESTGNGSGRDAGPALGRLWARFAGRALPAWAPTAALVGVVAFGLLFRFVARSNLWLDEALSVNIASLSVSDLIEALRHDGHPPLYYLLLHYWMELVGEGDVAVRALSGVFAVATLPLAWVAGRRVAGTSGARWMVALVAVGPFWIRYATEARMYSLVMLLVLAGYLLLGDALKRPTPLRLIGLALVSGLLLLSHYWTFWLLGAVMVLLAWRWWRDADQRRTTFRLLVGLAAGGLLFLPWLPNFFYQSTHTGTPWAGPLRPLQIVEVSLDSLGGGGTFNDSFVYGVTIVILCLSALFVVRSDGLTLSLDLRTVPGARPELAVVGLTATIGCVAAYAASATFQARYAAVFVPLLYLAVAVGLARLPTVARLALGGGLVAMSVMGVAWNLQMFHRTQSTDVSAAVRAHAEPGDVVLYCPDQLGPAFSREMLDGLTELAYPTLESPEFVDWVDYADRNEVADPTAIAADVRARAGDHQIFVVWRGEYETFGEQCEQVVSDLSADRAAQPLVSGDPGAFYEPASLHLISP